MRYRSMHGHGPGSSGLTPDMASAFYEDGVESAGLPSVWLLLAYQRSYVVRILDRFAASQALSRATTTYRTWRAARDVTVLPG